MAKRKLKFTKSVLDDLPIPASTETGKAGYVIFWDSLIPGFGIQVRPSGTKTFIFVYRNRQRRSRRYTLGRYGGLTLEQARKHAQELYARIRFGEDPVLAKQQDSDSKTIGEVFSTYIDEHLSKNCSPYALRSAKRVKELISSRLGTITLNQLSTADVRRFLNVYRNQPGNYNLIRTYLSAAWKWARDFGFGGLEGNSLSPMSGISLLPSTPRARVVTPTEYRAVFSAVQELMESRHDAGKLLACLFVIKTGCRLVDAIRLRLADVDRENRIVRLGYHKTVKRMREPKTIFLTAPVLEILARAEALRRMRGIQSEYVFPHNRLPKEESKWLQKTWEAVLKRADVHITPSQFRSAYINVGAGLGMKENEIADVTFHKSIQIIKKHYLSPNQSRAKANAERIAEEIESYIWSEAS